MKRTTEEWADLLDMLAFESADVTIDREAARDLSTLLRATLAERLEYELAVGYEPKSLSEAIQARRYAEGQP
jgi:hypothetical protein